MNKFLVGLMLAFLGCGRVWAGEWLPWQALGGKQVPEQAGTVEIRFRREETGDDRKKGFLFEYQLRNNHPTLVAQVSLAFAWQDPQSLKWEDASIDRATVTEVGPKASSPARPVYSPEKTGVDHGALITWLAKKD